MRIQIDGVGTVNKGAELLLFAILQEIEKRFPHATVIYNDSTFMEDNQQAEYFHSKLKIVKPFYMKPCFVSFLKRFHIIGIIERLNPQWSLLRFLDSFSKHHINVLFNAAGFSISDSFINNIKQAENMEKYLKGKKKEGTKFIYLPQAFGPCEKEGTKACIHVLNHYADLVFARESISYDYLINEDFNTNKLYQHPDFTSLVSGIELSQYANLRSAVCLIPNMKMVEKHIIKYEDYLTFWGNTIETVLQEGKKVFVLNHEGIGDEKICKEISDTYHIPMVSGLNALATKGVISNSYMVISSRFHGVASSLNSAVPCLATSWSHKYELLFNDYQQNDCILNVLDFDDYKNKIVNMLQQDKNHATRKVLSIEARKKQEQSREMWNLIWNKIG